MTYNKTKMWKMRFHIFFMKLVALFISTAIFIGAGYTLYKIEGVAFVDEFIISACLLMFTYSLHYYFVKMIVDVREADPVQDVKLYTAFDQACILAKLPFQFSKPKLYVLKDDGINAFTWGINFPFLYGVPLIGSCVAVSNGCIEKCEHHELLGIISHEFGHIKAMDSLIANIAKIQNLVSNKLPNFFKGSKLSVFNIMIWATWGALALLLPLVGRLYSQEAERSADLYAVRLLDSADPLVSAFSRIIKDEDLKDERGDINAHLSGNHPVIHERLTYLLELKV